MCEHFNHVVNYNCITGPLRVCPYSLDLYRRTGQLVDRLSGIKILHFTCLDIFTNSLMLIHGKGQPFNCLWDKAQQENGIITCLTCVSYLETMQSSKAVYFGLLTKVKCTKRLKSY